MSRCEVCSAPARYSYFGTIACTSCKIFFKRHATLHLKSLQCKFTGGCDISILNRHICRFCRLKKCLDGGISPDLVRGPITKRSRGFNLSKVLTLTLFEADDSDLKAEQWNLISSLAHAYDERPTVARLHALLKEQDGLPMKLRYKPSVLFDLFPTILSSVQSFFPLNDHFRSLSKHDQLILLRSAVENASYLGAVIIFRQPKFFDYPAISEEIEQIYGTAAIESIKFALKDMDQDSTFIKLGFAMFACTMTEGTGSISFSADYLDDTKAVLRIQDRYVEAAWNHLLYKYDHQRAVQCFTNFIQCLLKLNQFIRETHRQPEHKELIEVIIQQTSQMLVAHK